MLRLLAGGAALLALAPMGAMAETPQKKDPPGLLESVGTATAGALGGTVGSAMGPVGTAVGGIVGQQIGKGAIGVAKRILGRDEPKAAPDAALASADTAATLPQTLIPDPPPLAVPPPPTAGVDQAAAAPVEILPDP